MYNIIYTYTIAFRLVARHGTCPPSLYIHDRNERHYIPIQQQQQPMFSVYILTSVLLHIQYLYRYMQKTYIRYVA